MDRQVPIRDLEQRIADLAARLPRHSTPPEMMRELEELEDNLTSLHQILPLDSNT